MTMKKAERKEAYQEIMSLMIKEDHAAAFDKLTAMCGSDTGLFVLTGYKGAVEQYKQKQKECN